MVRMGTPCLRITTEYNVAGISLYNSLCGKGCNIYFYITTKIYKIIQRMNQTLYLYNNNTENNYNVHFMVKM